MAGRQEYVDLLPGLKREGGILFGLVSKITNAESMNWHLSWRVKSVDSYLGKISRKTYKDPLKEIKDLIGIRIVVDKLSDIKPVIKTLRKEFVIDEENSEDNLEKLLNKGDSEGFGYRSYHLVAKASPKRLAQRDYKELVGRWFEIQVRTRAEDAWAAVSHDSIYKSEESVPKSLKRKFARIAALLETADIELDEVHTASQKLFDKAVRNFGDETQLDMAGFSAYIKKSKLVKYWVDLIRMTPTTIVPARAPSRELRLLQRAGIRSARELDIILDDAKRWGDRYLGKLFILRTHRYGRGTSPTFTDANEIVALLVFAAHPEILEDESFMTEYGPTDQIKRSMYGTVIDHPEN
jgi:putative GTP pyrophosphokinase